MSEQSMRALRTANEARIGASVLRNEVTARILTIEQALEDPRAQCMPVCRLLCAMPWWGPKKANDLLNRNFIWPTRKVRDLTANQRQLIAKQVQQR